MKTQKSLPQEPAKVYPELVELLAEITYHARKLTALTKSKHAGNAVGITKQGFEKHVKKVERAKEVQRAK